MHFVARLLGVALVLGASSATAIEPQRPTSKTWLELKPAMMIRNGKVPVHLTAERTSIAAKENLILELLIGDGDGHETLFNASFDRALPLPGTILVFSADKVYLGDLISRTGVQRKPGALDWRLLRGTDRIGTGLIIATKPGKAVVPGTAAPEHEVEPLALQCLTPGRYLLQAVIWRAAIVPAAEYDPEQAVVRRIVGRSEVLEIEVVNEDE